MESRFHTSYFCPSDPSAPSGALLQSEGPGSGESNRVFGWDTDTLALQPGAAANNNLCLSFSICELEVFIIPTFWVVVWLQGVQPDNAMAEFETLARFSGQPTSSLQVLLETC